MRNVTVSEIKILSVAIQGEPGCNSHMAAVEFFAASPFAVQIVPCALSAEVVERVDAGLVSCGVLPIENSLHGSVAEHYDLLLEHNLSVTAESSLRIRHNVIAAPGVRLEQVRRILSHPVALSQCRQWLRAHPAIEVVPFYDTAGSVKSLMETGSQDSAGLAPALAAQQYGAEVLVAGIEDHAQNYTRFLVLQKTGEPAILPAVPNKMSVAFALDHRPGSLVEALEGFRAAGLNLTRIESRPVPGKPWEYVFFVDLRFDSAPQLDTALEALRPRCVTIKELGRYSAA